jgi:hypothetical protein
MRKKISLYWPLAIVTPLLIAVGAASLASLYGPRDSVSRASQLQPGNDQFAAELARTVSYGLVDSEAPVAASGRDRAGLCIIAGQLSFAARARRFFR